MSVRLKVGVVGCGVGVGHIKGYQELPDLYSVEALCDIDPARAKAIAGEHGVRASIGDFDEFLRHDLDIVDICTPSALHFEQAKKALLAGRHVVVEKPFASSLAEAEARENPGIRPVCRRAQAGGVGRRRRRKSLEPGGRERRSSSVRG